MLDIKWIRDNEQEFEKLMKARSVTVNINDLLDLDEEKRQITTLIQQFQQAKNKKSKKLASLRGKATREFEDVKRDVEHINEKLNDLNKKLGTQDELHNLLAKLPNLPGADIPTGADESSNKLIRQVGTPKDVIAARDHVELGKSLDIIDFEQIANISGSRFVVLKKDLAKLERALINFMIDTHTTKFGFEELSVPVIVKNEAMYNVGQLPKFAEDSYAIEGGSHRLIPTAEVVLTNMVAGKILKPEDLPIRLVAYTECFRSEAGSAGRDTKGMIRNHQFGKVELVTISTPDNSNAEHEHMLGAAEEILQLLELPYQVMLLSSGDMGFAAQKTYDLEVWLPGQEKYREIASISNCGDFQARRMKARYKGYNASGTSLVHTLNGSGLAVGRTIVAILENYQNSDGTITIPKVLQSYMGGQTVISNSIK